MILVYMTALTFVLKAEAISSKFLMIGEYLAKAVQ